MVTHMDKRKIITLKKEGNSNREVARQTGFDRDTVSKYWNEYRRRLQELTEPGADTRAIQDSLFETPTRTPAVRTRTKYTPELFGMMGGCWREIVYDNMRNVVKKFIGKGKIDAQDVVKPVSRIDVSARAHISNYSALMLKNNIKQSPFEAQFPTILNFPLGGAEH